MNKKILLIGIVLFLLSISNVFAGVNDADGAVAYYSFDDDLTDITPSEWDLTATGAVRSSTQSYFGGTSLFLDGNNDFADSGTEFYQFNGTTETWCAWLYRTDTSSGTIIKHTDAGSFEVDLGLTSGSTFQPSVYDGATQIYDSTPPASGSLNTWVHYCMSYDGSNMKVYIDKTLVSNVAGSITLNSNDEILIGLAGSNYLQGYVDEIAIYDEVKTQTGIDAIYDLTENPFTSEPASDEIIPQVVEVTPTVDTIINSATYQDIFSTTFEPVNDTSFYTTFTTSLEATNKAMDTSCRITINGTDYGSEVNRTLSNGEIGNLYIFSNEVNATAGNTYGVTLQCKRTTSGGQLRVFNPEGLVTIMTASDGTPIVHNHYEGVMPINSTSYQVLYNTTFETSDLTGTNLEIILSADGRINYDYTSTGTISLYATIDDESSAEFERYGLAGTGGSGSGLSLTKNVTNSTNVTFTIYGKSTSGDGSVDINSVLSEFFMHTAESQTLNLSGTTLPKTATWTTVKTLYINNSNHATGDILTKASISAKDSSGFGCTQNYRIKAGTSYSQEYPQTLSTNPKVVTLQHTMANPGLVNQSIELQTSNDCTASNVISATGGSIMGYMVFEIANTPQFYRVTAQDEASNVTINTFNVTSDVGTLYQTITGSIDIFHVNGLDTFNVTAENYQTNVTINHDTTTNLTVNMRPDPLEDFTLLTPANGSESNSSEINITWTESVSPTGKAVTYNISSIYEINDTIFESFTTTNLSYSLDISSYSSDDYIISVTAIEDLSNYELQKNASVFINRPNFLYFFNQQTGLPIQDANITIDLPNYGTDIEAVTDSDGKVFFLSFYNDTLQTGDFAITFEAFIGYVTPITFFETYSSLPVNESFDITVTNINVTVYYRSNSSIFTLPANVIIEGIANYTVSNGSVFIQNATITNGEYRLTVSSDGFFNEEKSFTFTGQDDLDLNIYMLELNSSNSGTVTVRTIDEFSRLLGASQVNLLEYDTSTLSYIEVSECFTDSNGECKFLVETNTKSYKFSASKIVNGQLVTAITEKGQTFEDDISGGEVVLFSEETITLTLSSQDEYVLNPINNIIYDITENFNNVTNTSNIDVSFRSIDGTNLQVCVEFFEVTGGVEVSKTGNTFCVIASSAEVTENAFFTLNRSKDYIAKVYIKTNTGNVLLEPFRYKSTASFVEQLRSNATLPFVFLFIWLFIIGGSLMLKNVPLAGISIILFSWLLVYFFPNITITSGAVLQTMIGLSLIYVGRKKEDFQ